MKIQIRIGITKAGSVFEDYYYPLAFGTWFIEIGRWCIGRRKP